MDYKNVKWPEEAIVKGMRLTRLDDDACEFIKPYSGYVSDTIILTREACARLVADDLKELYLVHETGNSRIEVKVRA